MEKLTKTNVYIDTVTSTVMLTMTTEKGNAGNVLLSGSLTRKAKDKVLEVNSDDDHIVNMGKLVEEIEIAIRGEVSFFGCLLHFVQCDFQN